MCPTWMKISRDYFKRSVSGTDTRLKYMHECSLAYSGVCHVPDSAELNSASITAIILIASYSGTGNSVSSKIALENASPCSVY